MSISDQLDKQTFFHPIYTNFKIIATSIQQDSQSSILLSSKNKYIFRPVHKLLQFSRKNQQNTQKKNGHWSLQENQKYFIFLNAHKQQFQEKSLRRSERIFKFMSNYLQTRTAAQCRSHHQKMEKKCSGFENILKYLNQICKQSGLCQKKYEQWKKVVKQCKIREIQDKIQEEYQVIDLIDNSEQLQSYYQMPRSMEPCYDLRWKQEKQSTNGEFVKKQEAVKL